MTSFALSNIERVEILDWTFTRRLRLTRGLFHPTQFLEDQPDGSLILRFRAGGALEM